jgi:nucleotide-binding universal stress UspA family protein
MNSGVKVLLAVDNSDSSEAAARAIAKQFRTEDIEVCILHALDWQRAIPSSFAFARGGTYGGQLCSIMEHTRQKAAALVASLAGVLRAKGFRTSTAVVDGGPLRTILGRAAEWKADLIVLGAHRRSGLERIFESVSEKVARQAPCSVEIVRPHAG